jgi:hypothetical protein
VGHHLEGRRGNKKGRALCCLPGSGRERLPEGPASPEVSRVTLQVRRGTWVGNQGELTCSLAWGHLRNLRAFPGQALCKGTNPRSHRSGVRCYLECGAPASRFPSSNRGATLYLLLLLTSQCVTVQPMQAHPAPPSLTSLQSQEMGTVVSCL